MMRYEPVFGMYFKIRVIMGPRDDSYRLEDMVEYDEAFVGKAIKKKGLGIQKQAKVAVMAELSVLENPKSGKLD